jgi:hypothetical protein
LRTVNKAKKRKSRKSQNHNNQLKEDDEECLLCEQDELSLEDLDHLRHKLRTLPARLESDGAVEGEQIFNTKSSVYVNNADCY